MYGKAVVFNGGEGKEHQLAFITKDHGGGTADLLVVTASGNSALTSVPRRAPSEYGPEGGGHTWHEAG